MVKVIVLGFIAIVLIALFVLIWKGLDLPAHTDPYVGGGEG